MSKEKDSSESVTQPISVEISKEVQKKLGLTGGEELHVEEIGGKIVISTAGKVLESVETSILPEEGITQTSPKESKKSFESSKDTDIDLPYLQALASTTLTVQDYCKFSRIGKKGKTSHEKNDDEIFVLESSGQDIQMVSKDIDILLSLLKIVTGMDMVYTVFEDIRKKVGLKSITDFADLVTRLEEPGKEASSKKKAKVRKNKLPEERNVFPEEVKIYIDAKVVSLPIREVLEKIEECKSPYSEEIKKIDALLTGDISETDPLAKQYFGGSESQACSAEKEYKTFVLKPSGQEVQIEAKDFEMLVNLRESRAPMTTAAAIYMDVQKKAGIENFQELLDLVVREVDGETYEEREIREQKQVPKMFSINHPSLEDLVRSQKHLSPEDQDKLRILLEDRDSDTIWINPPQEIREELGIGNETFIELTDDIEKSLEKVLENQCAVKITAVEERKITFSYISRKEAYEDFCALLEKMGVEAPDIKSLKQ